MVSTRKAYSHMLNVLLTDAAFTGLIRTLRDAYGANVRIIGLSGDPYTAHQELLDEFLVVKYSRDLDYVDRIIQIANEFSVDVMIPIITDELELLAEKRTYIEQSTNAKVLIASFNSIRIANDKGLLYDALSHSIDPIIRDVVPPFRIAKTKADLFYAIRELKASGRGVCMKRCRGEDASGFYRIVDFIPAADFFDEKDRRSLTTDDLENKLRSIGEDEAIPEYLVSEYLPGAEWDCDVLCRDGELLCVTTRLNLQMFGGLTSVLRVESNPTLEAHCGRIVKELKLSYAACISFREDISGVYKLLEINPRMMGNILVSSWAGNNYAKMCVDLLNGHPISATVPKSGIVSSLYYDQMRLDRKIPTEEGTK